MATEKKAIFLNTGNGQNGTALTPAEETARAKDVARRYLALARGARAT